MLQCVSKAEEAPEMESKVYWSTALEKAPVKASLSIHFSRTSQPPRLTPRRNGIDVAVAVAEVLVNEVVEVDVEGVEVDLDFDVVTETNVEDGFSVTLENGLGMYVDNAAEDKAIDVCLENDDVSCNEKMGRTDDVELTGSGW